MLSKVRSWKGFSCFNDRRQLVTANFASAPSNESIMKESKMLDKKRSTFQKLLSWVSALKSSSRGAIQMRIIKQGSAMRVIFFYPGEEGTYVDHANVTLYENGIVHISSHQEETTTHLQNCEILWRFETEAEERVNKVRLLKPKPEPKPESAIIKVQPNPKKSGLNSEQSEKPLAPEGKE
jgi:hypothetical protein